MTNQAVIDDLSKAKDRAMRMVAQRLIEAYDMAEFVPIIGEELTKRADTLALRTGDYEGASKLACLGSLLINIDSAIYNYDGAPRE